MDTPSTAPASASLWHDGERAMQARAGVERRMAEIGPRVIRDHLIEQHRQFYPLLPFIVLGAVDAQGEVWATLRGGWPGFAHSPDPSTLRLDLPRDADDPAEAGLVDGASVALLGIELPTRRRNRLNGRIGARDASGFTIAVTHSYGNCPQYIRPRQLAYTRDPALPATAPASWSEGLDARARQLIAGAETFFVASYVDRDDAGRQVDVSHRGGAPGFVQLSDDGLLLVPDYAGNSFFNTLGNLLLNPRAGLVFVDFARGDLLQISGEAQLLDDAASVARFAGAERLWTVRPRRVAWRAAALPLQLA